MRVNPLPALDVNAGSKCHLIGVGEDKKQEQKQKQQQLHLKNDKRRAGLKRNKWRSDGSSKCRVSGRASSAGKLSAPTQLRDCDVLPELESPTTKKK